MVQRGLQEERGESRRRRIAAPDTTTWQGNQTPDLAAVAQDGNEDREIDDAPYADITKPEAATATLLTAVERSGAGMGYVRRVMKRLLIITPLKS